MSANGSYFDERITPPGRAFKIMRTQNSGTKINTTGTH